MNAYSWDTHSNLFFFFFSYSFSSSFESSSFPAKILLLPFSVTNLSLCFSAWLKFVGSYLIFLYFSGSFLWNLSLEWFWLMNLLEWFHFSISISTLSLINEFDFKCKHINWGFMNYQAPAWNDHNFKFNHK